MYTKVKIKSIIAGDMTIKDCQTRVISLKVKCFNLTLILTLVISVQQLIPFQEYLSFPVKNFKELKTSSKVLHASACMVVILSCLWHSIYVIFIITILTSDDTFYKMAYFDIFWQGIWHDQFAKWGVREGGASFTQVCLKNPKSMIIVMKFSLFSNPHQVSPFSEF